MPNYDDFMKKAKDALDTIADVSVEAYKLAEEKAKVLAKRAKLNAEITREKAFIRRAKITVGNEYYALHKNDAENALKQYCDDITASLAAIEGMQAQLEDLRKGAGTGNTCCDEREEDAENCDSECCKDKSEDCCAPGEGDKKE